MKTLSPAKSALIILIITYMVYILLCAPVSGQIAQEALLSDRLEAIAIREVQDLIMHRETKTDKPPRLRVVRNDDLEQRLWALQVPVGRAVGRSIRDIRVYSILPYGLMANQGIIEAEAVELDDSITWLIVVDPRDLSVFRMLGFPNARDEFNRLIQDLHINIQDQDTAAEVAELYLELTRECQARRNVVPDLDWLQIIALQDFRKRYSQSDRKARFSSWWRRVQISAKSQLSGISVSVSPLGYYVNFVYYSGGSITRNTLRVSKNGKVEELNETKIFSP
jgi:hypothetical protein